MKGRLTLIALVLLWGCEPAEEDLPPQEDPQPDMVDPQPDMVDPQPDMVDPPVEVEQCQVGFSDPNLIAAIETAMVSPLFGDANRTPRAHGIVVGMASPEFGFHIQSFGFADVEDTTPMSPDAVFDIGSIQKNFRWTLMYHLAEQGLFDVDASVNSVIESPDFDGATFRQLSMHMGGLKHWDDTPNFSQAAFSALSEPISFETMMGFLTEVGDTPFVTPPGTIYRYSNYGPLIATEAMARVMDKDVETLTREEIIGPLHLQNTSEQGTGTNPEGLADGFWADDSPHTWADDPLNEVAIATAAGGLIFSNACDLLRYSNGIFHDESFLTSETVGEMLATETAWLSAGGDVVGTATAGFHSFLPGYVGHFGSSQHGHSSMYMHRLSDGTSFVVVANVASDTVPSFFDAESGGFITLPGDEYNTQLAVMMAIKDFVAP